MLKNNNKKNTPKRFTSALKLEIGKKNLSKIQEILSIFSLSVISGVGFFPPRSPGPKGHCCELLQSRLQKVSWQDRDRGSTLANEYLFSKQDEKEASFFIQPADTVLSDVQPLLKQHNS